MNEHEFDILQSSKDLKKMPFTVPENFFETMKAEARKCTEPQVIHVSLWTRLAPYTAIAAMFLFIFTLGNIFLHNSSDQATASIEDTIDVIEYEDYLVFNEVGADVSIYYLAEEDYAMEKADDEDIIEYLIYTGASESYIEYNKQQ